MWDTNADTNSDRNRNANCYCYANSYSHSYTYANGYIHTDTNGHVYSYTDGNSHSYTNTNSYSYADSDGHSNSHAHADSYGNGYCYSYGHSYGHSYGYAYTDSYAYGHLNSYIHADTDTNSRENKPDTEAASDAAASPIGATRKRLCGNSRETSRVPRLRWIDAPVVAGSRRDESVRMADVFATPKPNEGGSPAKPNCCSRHGCLYRKNRDCVAGRHRIP